MFKWLWLVLLLLSTSVFARIIPTNTLVGRIDEVVPNQVTISRSFFSRATLTTAPGLRVFTQNNVLIFVRNLPLETMVAYQLDTRGELIQIWMLTEQEIVDRKAD